MHLYLWKRKVIILDVINMLILKSFFLRGFVRNPQLRKMKKVMSVILDQVLKLL